MKNIISIIVIAVSLAAFVLVVKPQYAEVKKLEVKSKELDQVLVNARKLQSLRDDLLTKRRSLKNADVSRLEKMIPENSDNVKLIIQLQNIAQQYGLELQTVSAEDNKNTDQDEAQNFDIETKDYGVIKLDFSVTGGYPQFVSFLAHLEDNLRIIDLRTLGITSKEGQDFDFSMLVETYWIKDNI